MKFSSKYAESVAVKLG